MTNPHDAFFKSLFSDTAELINLLRDLLHTEVVRQLDLNALQPLPTEVVRESLNLGLSDLRFSVPWRAGGHLALRLLLEHQSTVDPTSPYAPYATSWTCGARPHGPITSSPSP